MFYVYSSPPILFHQSITLNCRLIISNCPLNRSMKMSTRNPCFLSHTHPFANVRIKIHQCSFSLSFIISVYDVHVWVQLCTYHYIPVTAEGIWSILSFYHVGLVAQTEAAGLGSKHPYLASHFTSSLSLFEKESCISQASPNLTMRPRRALNIWSSCLCLWNTGENTAILCIHNGWVQVFQDTFFLGLDSRVPWN